MGYCSRARTSAEGAGKEGVSCTPVDTVGAGCFAREWRGRVAARGDPRRPDQAFFRDGDVGIGHFMGQSNLNVRCEEVKVTSTI